jgi:hypothetical protein
MDMNYMYQRTIINHNLKMASKAGLDTQSVSTIVEFLFLSLVIRAELRVASSYTMLLFNIVVSYCA